MGRLGVAIGCLVLGVAAAGAAVLVHTLWWGWILGIGAGFATAVWLPRVWWARVPFCGAWTGTVLWLTPARSDGSYLIGTDLAGYALLLAGMALMFVGLTGLLPPRVQGVPGADIPRP